MRRAIVIFVCLCAIAAAEYIAISEWAIRHETLDLFDTARQRPISVDLAVRRAGLDRDPGWVPWLEKRVRFAFGEDDGPT